jgi:DNA-binding response OmpR family regulator
MAGFKVEILSNSMGATRIISAQKPDLLLMEVNMPGLSGPALVSILRKLYHAKIMPVIFHSALSEEGLKNYMQTCGALGYIRKGINIDQFIEQVKRFSANAGENIFYQQANFKSLQLQPRLKLNFPITVIGHDTKGEEFQEETVTEDVSRGGACFTINRIVAENAVLRIVVRNSETEREAIVCWVRDYRGSCRLGVKFYFDLEDPWTFS